MNCKFVYNENKDGVKCIRCNNQIKTNHPPEKCFAECQVSDCIHFINKKLRKQSCSSCNGNVQINIYGCKIHKECCLSDKLSNIQNCNTCNDFSE